MPVRQEGFITKPGAPLLFILKNTFGSQAEFSKFTCEFTAVFSNLTLAAHTCPSRERPHGQRLHLSALGRAGPGLTCAAERARIRTPGCDPLRKLRSTGSRGAAAGHCGSCSSRGRRRRGRGADGERAACAGSGGARAARTRGSEQVAGGVDGEWESGPREPGVVDPGADGGGCAAGRKLCGPGVGERMMWIGEQRGVDGDARGKGGVDGERQGAGSVDRAWESGWCGSRSGRCGSGSGKAGGVDKRVARRQWLIEEKGGVDGERQGAGGLNPEWESGWRGSGPGWEKRGWLCCPFPGGVAGVTLAATHDHCKYPPLWIPPLCCTNPQPTAPGAPKVPLIKCKKG
ncbi:uncharacterized PE-PGRS family protein PE_PGRS54-like [Prionailurus bengalensis]|uniref:uncharacterized PE-PGRS family protein PE_PGRS54-like n=1 Tax=Prionailurus bengalensis TaxID=37029 RepID=UPI001CA955BE|nr:uncharacterized PE-PGRS family protein PE_PGRS54-like [Prionailurus bengalensis]